MYVDNEEILEMIENIKSSVKSTLSEVLESFEKFIFSRDNHKDNPSLYEVSSDMQRRLCFDLLETISVSLSETLDDGGPSCSPCIMTQKQYDDYNKLIDLRRHAQSVFGLSVTW